MTENKAQDAEFKVLEGDDLKANGTVVAARLKRQCTVDFFMQVSERRARIAFLKEMFPHHYEGELESDYMDFVAIADQLTKISKEKNGKAKEESNGN